MGYILALDQGTTSSRALVFGHDASLVATAQKELTQHFPAAGWVEHDPLEIWGTQVGVAQEALALAGISASDVSAIGVTNQRETVVLWERSTGRPVHPAIVWQDRRTATECDRLRSLGLEQEIQSRTGLLLDPYFSATKIAWILDSDSQLRSRAERGELAFGTVDSWLLYCLTGGQEHCTDATNASRTLLFNIKTLEWDPFLLDTFRVPRELLPEVKPSGHLFGETAKGLLGAQIPICSLVGDQQAATFGQGCIHPGMVKNTYGTGCFMLMNTGDICPQSDKRMLSTIALQQESATTYALEGSVFMAGATIQWLRDGLGVIRASSEVEALASSVEDSDGVYLVPAFVGLGAPYWDSYARASIHGMSRGTTKAHIARAALESIAFQSAEVLFAMESDTGRKISEVRVDGGATQNNLLMQFQADLLGVPVVRPRLKETTAFGAAKLAAFQCGAWESSQTADLPIETRFEPMMTTEKRERCLERWREAVQRTLGWENS